MCSPVRPADRTVWERGALASGLVHDVIHAAGAAADLDRLVLILAAAVAEADAALVAAIAQPRGEVDRG